MLSIGLAEEKTEEELRADEFERVHLKLLQEGMMFTRQQGGWSIASLTGSGGNQSVWVKLDKAKTAVEWATLEQRNNAPTDSGTIPLLDIKSIGKRENTIIFRDARDSETLVVESTNKEEREKFQYALQEAIELIAPKLEGQEEKNAKAQKRLEELEARRVERQKKKDALGHVGMEATARIMMNQK